MQKWIVWIATGTLVVINTFCSTIGSTARPTAPTQPTITPETATAPWTANPASPGAAAGEHKTYLPTMANTSGVGYRTHIPLLADPAGVDFDQMAIFWFGKISPTENYIETRVAYTSTEIYVRLTVFDRLIWYNESNPSAANLPNWDSVSVYFDLNNGSSLSARTFRLDAGARDDWLPPDDYQYAYTGANAAWTPASLAFSTSTYARWESATVGGLNNGQDNRGWILDYHIPLSSLGLSAAPAASSVWKLAVAVHDRDDFNSAPNPDKVWPPAMQAGAPATWGTLVFGAPVYTPAPAVTEGTLTLRNQLNGVSVPDAMVGGGTLCGATLNYWTEWGNSNDAGASQVNVQNQADVADWPCFSKYYITFPLSGIPPGKVIKSAVLTMYQFGNSGVNDPEDPSANPLPSYIQLFAADQDWSDTTITWNNAPLSLDNFGGSWVDILAAFPGIPGVARTWNVAGITSYFYQQGAPLRLILYSADHGRHSGKYFTGSDVEDFYESGRPTLVITWGRPAN
jgi:hypothetical protein